MYTVPFCMEESLCTQGISLLRMANYDIFMRYVLLAKRSLPVAIMIDMVGVVGCTPLVHLRAGRRRR